MTTKTPVAAWLLQFLEHQPHATPTHAWDFLTSVAIPTGMLQIEHDAERRALVYRAGPERRERSMSRASFARQVQRLRAKLAAQST